MSLKFLNQNLVVVVVGCSGSGKSTYAIRYMLNAKFSCRFIFDPRGEYAEKLKRRPCTIPAELNAAVATGWVVFDPSTLFPGNPKVGFEMFCEWAWTQAAKLRGNSILFADEIWKFCNPNLIPLPLAQIVQDGRKNGIGLLATTQRPNKLNETIIAEATELISFRLVGENAIGFIEKTVQNFPSKKVSGLPMLHYVAQNLLSGGLAQGVLKF